LLTVCVTVSICFQQTAYVFNKLCNKWHLLLGRLNSLLETSVFLHIRMIVETCHAFSFNCEVLQRHTTNFYLAVSLFLLSMHSSATYLTIAYITCPQSLCFYEVPIPF